MSNHQSERLFRMDKVQTSGSVLQPDQGFHSKSPLHISQVFSKSLTRDEEQKSIVHKDDSIRVRTPGQLNGTVQRIVFKRKSLPSQITVKRILNKTIQTPSSKSATKVGEALQAQMDRLKSQSRVMMKSKADNLLIVPARVPHPVTPTTPTVATLPNVANEDAKEKKPSYIGLLAEENYRLRNLLKDCLKDAAEVRAKMDEMSKVIENALKTPTNKTGRTNQFSTQPPVYRLPTFPIRSINALTYFEHDLKSREFNEYVTNTVLHTQQLAQNAVFEKPAVLLTYILFSLVTSDMLAKIGRISWDKEANEDSGSTNDTNYMKQFTNFKSLFIRLSNIKSHEIFGRNMSTNAIEQFLMKKVDSQRTLRGGQAKKEPMAKIRLQTGTNAGSIRPLPKQKQNRQQHSGELDNDNETEKMIEWLDDNRMFETAMNGSSRTSTSEDSSQHNDEVIDDRFDYLGF